MHRDAVQWDKSWYVACHTDTTHRLRSQCTVAWQWEVWIFYSLYNAVWVLMLTLHKSDYLWNLISCLYCPKLIIFLSLHSSAIHHSYLPLGKASLFRRRKEIALHIASGNNEEIQTQQRNVETQIGELKMEVWSGWRWVLNAPLVNILTKDYTTVCDVERVTHGDEPFGGIWLNSAVTLHLTSLFWFGLTVLVSSHFQMQQASDEAVHKTRNSRQTKLVTNSWTFRR